MILHMFILAFYYFSTSTTNINNYTSFMSMELTSTLYTYMHSSYLKNLNFIPVELLEVLEGDPGFLPSISSGYPIILFALISCVNTVFYRV